MNYNVGAYNVSALYNVGVPSVSTLVVEDGSGLADAESYISVADATTFHDARGNSAWDDLSLSQQEQCLRRATDYMEQVYRRRWKGERLKTTQALCWPRACVELDDAYRLQGTTVYFPQDEVPTEVARACAMLALAAIGGDLSPSIGRLKSRVKVGPIETEYVVGASPRTKYPAVDGILQAYLRAGGGSLMVFRA